VDLRGLLLRGGRKRDGQKGERGNRYIVEGKREGDGGEPEGREKGEKGEGRAKGRKEKKGGVQ